MQLVEACEESIRISIGYMMTLYETLNANGVIIDFCIIVVVYFLIVVAEDVGEGFPVRRSNIISSSAARFLCFSQKRTGFSLKYPSLSCCIS